MKYDRYFNGICLVLIFPLIVWLVGPLLWMGLLSFRPISNIISGLGTLTSNEFTLENYFVAVNQTDLLVWLKNTAIVTLVSTFICCFLGVLGGYAMARFYSKKMAFVSLIMLASQIFPEPLLAIPMYMMMLTLGLTKYPFICLIITFISMGLPYATWMLANYIRLIPVDLEESAMIDGCTRFQSVFRIILPVIGPGAAAAFIFVFLTAWGDFLWPLIFTNKSSDFLLSVGLLGYSGDMASLEWGTLIAMSTVYALPAIILFYFLEKRMVGGLAAGAVKS